MTLLLLLTPRRSAHPSILSTATSLRNPILVTGNVVSKKRVEDVVPIATGHEPEVIQAELEGRRILEIDFPEGPFGTNIMDTKKQTSIVMLPWLAHGHLSPYFELAKKLSNKNFSVHFCSTPINLSSIKPNLDQENQINLVEINLPSLPYLPADRHRTKGLPPHLLPTLVKTFVVFGPGLIKNILETVKPNLIIFDIMQPWLPSIASSLRIPAVHFLTAGVAASSFFYRICNHPGAAYPFSGICLTESEIKKISYGYVPRPPGSYSDGDLFYGSLDGSCDMVLMKCCEEMEGKYMDFISDLSKKKVVSVGPLLVHDSIYVHDDNEQTEILEWLSKKEESSTLFVSFGSESFLSKEEMKEVAHGLEGSKVNFIWVIRISPGEEKKIMNVEEVLPEGFLERVKERGKIVFGWAPQVRILKHASIGGFLSHCGWSSIMESLSFGVPIIAMPLQYDQPINARMLVEVGVAMEVLRDENGVAKQEEVAKVIKEVMVEEGGGDLRRKARELGEKIRAKGDEDIDCLVEELQELCKKYNGNMAEEIVDAGN